VLPATGIMDTRFMLLAALMGFGGALLLVGLNLRGRRAQARAKAQNDQLD
jgi:hypothetical protein